MMIGFSKRAINGHPASLPDFFIVLNVKYDQEMNSCSKINSILPGL